MTVKRQVHGAAHAQIVEGFFGIVDPQGVNHTLVEIGKGQVRHGFKFSGRYRVNGARIVHLAPQQRRGNIREPGIQVVNLQAVQVGQPLVPVVGVLLHDPHFFINALHMSEQPRHREIHHRTEAVVVVLQRLLAYDNVPAAGKSAEHEILRAGLAQDKLNGARVAHIDGTDGREQRRARAAKPLGRPDDTRRRWRAHPRP